MRPLFYSINITLDGCCDHTAIVPPSFQAIHEFATETIARADVLLLGRTTYEMMEGAWRIPDPSRPAWMTPFQQTIDRARKAVVSSTLPRVDWNAELVTGDLASAVRALKAQPGKGIYTGGVKLPMALAELGLIDEYHFVVTPSVVGRGPALFAGLSKPLDLSLVGRRELAGGAVVLQYAPRR